MLRAARWRGGGVGVGVGRAGGALVDGEGDRRRSVSRRRAALNAAPLRGEAERRGMSIDRQIREAKKASRERGERVEKGKAKNKAGMR